MLKPEHMIVYSVVMLINVFVYNYLIYQPIATADVTADIDGFNVTLKLLRDGIDGVFLIYGPSHAFSAKYGSERHTIIGVCNETRSDLVKVERGQTVFCKFPATLVVNLEYSYEVAVMINGDIATVESGSLTPKKP